MTDRQTIWVQSDATHFVAPCTACQEEAGWPGERSIAPTVVEGSLRLAADVGFLTCWRGHRIRVRRIARARRLTAA